MDSKFFSTQEEMKNYIEDNQCYDLDMTEFKGPRTYFFDTENVECGRCWPRGCCSHLYLYSYTAEQAQKLNQERIDKLKHDIVSLTAENTNLSALISRERQSYSV